MRVLLSAYDSRGGVEPLLGLAVQLPGRPLPPDVTDNQTLWDLNAQGYNELYGPALNAHRVANGLPAADNVRAHVLGDHPWLAADPILAPWHEPADLDVVQTGAWFVPDERPLPAERTTAAPAPRRRPPGQARPRWWCPNGRTSRTSPAGWLSLALAQLTTCRLRRSSPFPPRSARP